MFATTIIDVRLAHPAWSSYRIAKEVGCHAAHVRNTLRKRGLRLAASKHGKRLLPWERQAVTDAYAEGEKVEALAAEMSVTRQTIQRHARKAGLPYRFHNVVN